MSSVSLPEYEDFLGSLRLFPDLFRNKSLEMDLKGALNPSHLLNESFFNQRRWLSFSEFHDLYFEKYKDTIKEKFSFAHYDEFEEGLRSRLYRTQFGFLTEYHAFFLAVHVFGNENVYRTTELDTLGVDFRVRIGSEAYNIHIFVDTPRSWNYRNYKSQFKNSESVRGIHVNLPYSLKSGRFNSLRFLKNGFGVYTEHYLNHFRNEALSGKIQNNNITGTEPNGFVYAAKKEIQPK